jgi:Rod binding domain-containing protein
VSDLTNIANIATPSSATLRIDGLEQARRAADRGDAEAAAQKFEALLATQLVKEMRRGVGGGFFGGGAGSDVFEGWFDEHLGQALADSNALDLAAAVRFELTQNTAEERP